MRNAVFMNISGRQHRYEKDKGGDEYGRGYKR